MAAVLILALLGLAYCVGWISMVWAFVVGIRHGDYDVALAAFFSLCILAVIGLLPFT